MKSSRFQFSLWQFSSYTDLDRKQLQLNIGVKDKCK